MAGKNVSGKRIRVGGFGMANMLSCLFAALIFCVFLSGCDKTVDYNETTISISKKGIVKNEIVEGFSQVYYKEDELRSMIEEEVGEYAGLTGDKDRVKFDDLTVEKGKVKVMMTYKSYEDYADFNDVEFFYGTVNEAMTDGFSLEVTMKSTVDGSNIGKDDIMKLGSSKMIIISEPVMVESYSDILYVTANVEMVDKRHARMSSDSSGRAYLIIE
ncbi:MAG: hypothetical protein K6G22_01245 [Lachnospiraceae bacterium]|nr:hypothetical protein [Lachnospiraceae bacterium]